MQKKLCREPDRGLSAKKMQKKTVDSALRFVRCTLVFHSFRCEPTATHPLYLSPVSLCIDSTSTSTAEAAPSPVSLCIDSTSTAEAAASVKPREGEARRLGGSAERPRRSDEAAVGEPALLLVDGAVPRPAGRRRAQVRRCSGVLLLPAAEVGLALRFFICFAFLNLDVI
jgi:hypothetical protein